MTPETLSIPIETATGCCAEPGSTAVVLPGSAVPLADEACCQSSPAVELTPVGAGGDPVGTHAHGDSCSHQPAGTSEVATNEAAVAPEAATDQTDAAPDDGALIDALKQVIDPELMINIVDLGLVYSINQTDRKVLVEMTLTSPACPAGPQIISQAKMSLEKLSGVDVAEIKLTMSPPWTPDRMTDDARDQLGIF
jgi:metal-sulfur cluster biosynthetic enzyme